MRKDMSKTHMLHLKCSELEIESTSRRRVCKAGCQRTRSQSPPLKPRAGDSIELQILLGLSTFAKEEQLALGVRDAYCIHFVLFQNVATPALKYMVNLIRF